MNKIKLIILSIFLCLLTTENIYAQELIDSQQKELAVMKQQWKEMHQQLYELADNLEVCEKFSQKFTHPFTGTHMERKVAGIIDEKCAYSEEMPNNGKMECKYSEEFRVEVAKYYRDLANAELSDKNIETKVEAETNLNGEQEVKTTYTIDGNTVENPLDKAMNDDDICTFTEYE